MDELNKAKEIFLSPDIDEETRAENMKDIHEWESDLLKNENMVSWLEHDVTKEIMAKARKTYTDLSMSLILNRDFTEQQRMSIYAKQDACLFILSLGDHEAKSKIETIINDIRKVINTTNM